MSMKPPPPRFPAEGWVTARAKATATAASTALPPWRRISIPASAAKGSAATTIPFVPRATSGGGLCAAAGAGPARQRASSAASSADFFRESIRGLYPRTALAATTELWRPWLLPPFGSAQGRGVAGACCARVAWAASTHSTSLRVEATQPLLGTCRFRCFHNNAELPEGFVHPPG